MEHLKRFLLQERNISAEEVRCENNIFGKKLKEHPRTDAKSLCTPQGQKGPIYFLLNVQTL